MDAGGANGRQLHDTNFENAVSRYPRRKPGGYRCWLERPVEPTPFFLGKRVSVKWEGVDNWHDGVVRAYNKENCKHVVDYDEPTGYPVEFRMGLDAKVKLDLPPGQEPRDASKGHLENLMRLLVAEATELNDCAAQDAQMLQPLLEVQTQIGLVSDLLQDLETKQQAAAAAQAASTMQKLPPDCPIMRRVGASLHKKWRQSPLKGDEVPVQDSLAPPAQQQQQQQQEQQKQQQQEADGHEADWEDAPQLKRRRQAQAGTPNTADGQQQQCLAAAAAAAGAAGSAGGDVGGGRELGCCKCKYNQMGCKVCRKQAPQHATAHHHQQQQQQRQQVASKQQNRPATDVQEPLPVPQVGCDVALQQQQGAEQQPKPKQRRLPVGLREVLSVLGDISPGQQQQLLQPAGHRDTRSRAHTNSIGGLEQVQQVPAPGLMQQQQQQQPEQQPEQQEEDEADIELQLAAAKHSRRRMQLVSACRSPPKAVPAAARTAAAGTAAAGAEAPAAAAAAARPTFDAAAEPGQQAASSLVPALQQQKQCCRSPLKPLAVGEPQQQQQQQLSELVKPKPSRGSTQAQLGSSSSSGGSSRRQRHNQALRGAANMEQAGLEPGAVPQQQQQQQQAPEQQAAEARAGNIPLELHRLSLVPRADLARRRKSSQASQQQEQQQQEHQHQEQEQQLEQQQQQQQSQLRVRRAGKSAQQIEQQQDAHALLPAQPQQQEQQQEQEQQQQHKDMQHLEQQEQQQEQEQQQQHKDMQHQQLCDGALGVQPASSSIQQQQQQQSQPHTAKACKKLGRELQSLLLEVANQADRPSSGSRSSGRSSGRSSTRGRQLQGAAAQQCTPQAAAVDTEAAKVAATAGAGEAAAAARVGKAAAATGDKAPTAAAAGVTAAEALALAAPPAATAGTAAGPAAPAPTNAATAQVPAAAAARRPVLRAPAATAAPPAPAVAATAQVPAAAAACGSVLRAVAAKAGVKRTTQQSSKPAVQQLKEGLTVLIRNTSPPKQQQQPEQGTQQEVGPSLQAAAELEGHQQPHKRLKASQQQQQQQHNQQVLSQLQATGQFAVQQQVRAQGQQAATRTAGAAAASKLAIAAAADNTLQEQQQQQQQQPQQQQPQEQQRQRQRPESSSAPLRSSTRTAAALQEPAAAAVSAAAAPRSSQRGTATPAPPAGAGTPASGGSSGAAAAAAAGCGSEGAAFVANKAAQVAASMLLKGGQVNAVNIPGLEFSTVEWVVQQLGPCMPLPQAQQKLDALQQQGLGQPARLDLLTMDQLLEDAYHEHMQSRDTHALFKEMDVSMRVSPEALVGRQLRVYWALDDAWFAGSVEAWDPKTAQHKVVYEDGEVAKMWMGVERTRLLITAGEELQRPDAATLQLLANRYSEQARQIEQSLAQRKGGASRDESEDLRETAKKLRAKAQVLLGAAYLKATEPPPDCWLVKKPAAAAGGSGGNSKHKKRKSSSSAPASRGATPAAAAGAGAAGAAGQVDGQAVEASEQQQQDQQQQLDQQQQALDVDAPAPAAAGLASDTCEGGAAAGDQSDGGGNEMAAKRMRLSRSQQPRPSAAAAAGGTPMRKHVLQQQASKHATLAHATTAAGAKDATTCSREQSPAADAAEERALDRSSSGSGGSSSSSTVKFSVLPGEVVWVQTKGNPPWPALVITAEEAADFSVDCRQPRVAQVAVQYFGDYTRLHVAASCIIPTSVALRQRLWLPTVLISSKQPAWVRMVQLYTNGLREFSTYCKTGELPDSEMVPEHNDERWLLEDREAEQQAAAASAQDAKAAAAGGRAKKKQPRPTTGTQAPQDMELDELLKWAGTFVAAVGAHTGHASSSKGKGAAGLKLPLQLANNLLLTCLGRVEFVHPRFHNDKFIFPVGFAVRRRARTPLSGDREVWHTAEILEDPLGTGPMFRVTPDGSPAVTGTTTTAAWQELYRAAAPADTISSSKASAAAIAARAASVCGPRLFGLQHPVVAALIQSLPDAARCDGFFAWKGPAPPTQAPTRELQLARRVISAHLSKLPPGITPQLINRRGTALCDSCGESAEVYGNHFVECDGCGLLVHMHCYGVQSHPHGESWLCDVCALPDLTQSPACTLCPCVGGAMKVTSEGGWCHLLCATWVPGCAVGDGARMEPITGTQRCLTKERIKLVCNICAQPHGACIQCADKRCVKAFHATCARGAGYPMVMLDDSDSEDDSDEEEQQQQHQHADAGGAGQQQHQQPGIAAGAAGRKPGGKGRGGKGRKSHHKPKAGTAVGDMCRLVCFCPKHHTQAVTLQGTRLHNLGPVLPAQASSMPQPSGSTAAAAGAAAAGAAAAAAARDGQPEVTSPAKGSAADAGAQPPAAAPGRALAFGSSKRSSGSGGSRGAAASGSAAAAAGGGSAAAAAAAAAAGPSGLGAPVVGPAAAAGPSGLGAPVVGPAAAPRQGVMLFGDSPHAPPDTCARSRPADMSTRRHLKAPDAAAVAQRKRMYMQALPHLVTGRCGTVRQLLPAPVSCARYTGPEFEQQQGAVAGTSAAAAAAGSSRRHQQPKAAAGAAAASAAAAACSSAAAAGAASGVLQLLHGRLPALGSLAAAVPVAQAAPASHAAAVRLSQGDRYRQMCRSVNDRLCTGKSAIHGLGVFTKRAHKAGDYLIEYVGQLVRPVVTDHLEKTTYNSMVGSGTYIFDLNMAASVDATRAGNMAHLINHSCGPCAHSRTITVRELDSGEPVDHVVIIASRDLEPGEELTYDYRFAGQEKLRCNCGAPSCRGWVNAPALSDLDAPRQRPDGSLMLPRSEVEFLTGAAAVAAVAAHAAAAPARKQAQP